MTSTENARARENARNKTTGEFGEQHKADPGNDLLADSAEQRQSVGYEIPSWGVSVAESKIAKANRRLARAGITERFEASWSEPFARTDRREDGSDVIHEYRTLTLNHPVLAYEGWEFVASLDDTGNGLIVRSRPGVDLGGWRPEAQRCDHCGKYRSRSETYVVRNEETGEMMQVGSSCMQNFLGIKPAGLWAIGFDPLAEEASDEDEPSERWGVGGRGEELQDVRLIVAAALIVSKDGRDYKPATFDDSTSGAVKDILWGSGGRDEDKQARAQLRDQAAELAASGRVDEVLAAVANMTPGSDYADNMRMLAGAEHARYRHAGLLASAVKVWAKQQEFEAAEKANPRKEGFIAPVGTKLNTLRTKDGRAGVAVTVHKVFYGTSFYGYRETPTTMLIMRTEDGQTLKWRASSDIDVGRGDDLLLTSGSVKEHSSYDGHDQTVLTRVKFDLRAG